MKVDNFSVDVMGDSVDFGVKTVGLIVDGSEVEYERGVVVNSSARVLLKLIFKLFFLNHCHGYNHKVSV